MIVALSAEQNSPLILLVDLTDGGRRYALAASSKLRYARFPAYNFTTPTAPNSPHILVTRI